MVRDRAHDPFLKAILEKVEDDAPRLIYADWLEERGDPRGEFIRVQCKLDKLSTSDPALPTLLEREQLLLREHRDDWMLDLPPLGRRLTWGEFHRGFPLAAVSFACEPCTNEDSPADPFHALTYRFNSFVNRGNPACLKVDASIDYDGGFPLEYMELLVESMDYVIELKAQGVRLNNASVKALATAPHIRTYLRRLDLTCGNYESAENGEPNDEAVETLANSPRMAYLRELVLDDQWFISDRGAAALAASPYLGRLTRLVVAAWSESGMTKTGEQALQSRFGDRFGFGCGRPA
jgi:uncharacterized protein (TIGR02996 family)